MLVFKLHTLSHSCCLDISWEWIKVRKQNGKEITLPLYCYCTVTKWDKLKYQPTKPLHLQNTNTLILSPLQWAITLLFFCPHRPNHESSFSKAHSDCGGSVLVMWFVTPSALLLVRLRTGLQTAVSNEMVACDRRSRAATRKHTSHLHYHTSPGNTGIENIMSAKLLGTCECVHIVPLFLPELIKWTWQHSLVHSLIILSFAKKHKSVCIR